jgi:parallel beta-helix repeat protein
VAAVTITANHVKNNNRALAAGACPGLPAFETLEQSDCGEGIHLLAASHSIISGNRVEGNSGGILLADDTGGTYANLITGNTVQNNPFACGITMASHPASPSLQPHAPFGVFHNTVYGNHSAQNGLGNGGGAGIGIFASVPKASNYGNVVANNYLDENGLPGIAIHGHVPGQYMNDNVLVGNTILDNGADTEDAATPGPTGINVFTAGDVIGTMIYGNSIESETVDIAVNTPSPVQINLNTLLGPGTGVTNLGSGPINANANWWGCDGAPGTSGCSSVSGPDIDFRAWLPVPVPPPSY